MAGVFAAKVLADGQLAIAKATLYTVPALTVAYMRYLTFFNTNAASQTVNLYLNTSGTSRQVKRYVLAQYESAIWPDPNVTATIQAGDLVEADTTTATAVDYVLTGVEET